MDINRDFSVVIVNNNLENGKKYFRKKFLCHFTKRNL